MSHMNQMRMYIGKFEDASSEITAHKFKWEPCSQLDDSLRDWRAQPIRIKAALLFSMFLFGFGFLFSQNSWALNGPVTCAIQTYDGHYVTAVGGGGRTTDVLHTDATQMGSWEKFTLIDSGDGSSNIHYGIKTLSGNYLTAVDGGGRITDVIHSDATQIQDWEKFTLISLGSGWYGIQTDSGNYLTATGAGGNTVDAIHSDATRIDQWEEFRLTCGI